MKGVLKMVMPSTAIGSQLHGFMFSTDEMRSAISDRAWIQKWLDTEAALAKAIGEFFKNSITIIPLLKEFKRILPDNASEYVHWGATSQGIVDTGIVLLQRDAYKIILRDMKACLKLAERTSSTPFR